MDIRLDALNFNITLEPIVENSYDKVISEDCQDFNSGSVLFWNKKRSREFLEYVFMKPMINILCMTV
jgi:hypothetical protein